MLSPLDWLLLGFYELGLKIKKVFGYYDHCPKCERGELKKWANFDWDDLKMTGEFKKCDKCGLEIDLEEVN